MATAPSPRGFGKDKSARSGRRTGARQCLAIAGSGRTAADRSTWVSCRAGGRFGLRRGLGNGEKAAPRAALASFPPGPKRRGAGGASPGPVARRRAPQGEGGAASPSVEDRDGAALDGAPRAPAPGRADAARSPRVDRARDTRSGVGCKSVERAAGITRQIREGKARRNGRTGANRRSSPEGRMIGRPESADSEPRPKDGGATGGRGAGSEGNRPEGVGGVIRRR